MRHQTVPWITTILGSMMVVPVALAQQSTPAPTNAGAKLPVANGSAAELQFPQEIASRREARYLLRNGLDYVRYQEYERALKFLHEAETRNAELNAAEKLTLKRGIESAQRGLREATDVRSPYALSEKSKHRNGFKPAQSVAQENAPTKEIVSRARAVTMNPARQNGLLRAGEDDQGEPIQLASGETPDDSNLWHPKNSHSTEPTSKSEKARSFPKIPKLNGDPYLTKITKPSPSLEQPPTALDLKVAISTSAPTVVASPLILSPSILVSEPKQMAESPLASTACSEDSHVQNIPLTPCPNSPAAELPMPITASSSASFSPPSSASSDPLGISPRQVPPSETVDSAAQRDSRGEVVHKESEDAAPPSTLEPAQGVRVTATVADAADTRQTVSRVSVDDFPPFPGANDNPATGEVKTPSAANLSAESGSQRPASALTDDLPPLPADIANLGSVKVLTNESAVTRVTSTQRVDSTNATQGAAPPQVGATSPDADLLGSAHNSARSQPSQASPGDTGTSPNSVGGLYSSSVLANRKPASSAQPTAAQALPASRPAPTTNPVSAAQEATTRPIDQPAGSDSEYSSIAEVNEAQGLSKSKAPSTTFESLSSRSILGPGLQREVEVIARRQEAELRNQRSNDRQPVSNAADRTGSDPRTQFQLDTSRAPSPAEARPIRAIPVPEDWVPLAPRKWSPQRKYWAAAATCHLPLYFQDPVLERYGHSVEQFVGPLGRYLTYPVDDPTQSTQRNQILQPFFSAGLFALQIAAWPYNLIMDPPWEAQYDLGYYRPGDNIPNDTYWLPLHGYGPPLHGSNY